MGKFLSGHATHPDWRMATELALAQLTRVNEARLHPLMGLVYASSPMADHFAERVTKDAGKATDAQVRLAWRLALGRAPDPAELGDATALVERHGLPALARTLFNSSELIWID